MKTKHLTAWLVCLFASTPLFAQELDLIPEVGPAATSDVSLSTTGNGQETSNNGSAGSTASHVKAEYQGSVSCVNCHVAPGGGYKLEGVTDFVMLKEFQIWLNADPHARGYLSIIPDEAHFNAVTKRLNRMVEIVGEEADDDSSPMRIPVWGASNELAKSMLQKMFGANYDRDIGSLFAEITKVQLAEEANLDKEQIAEFAPRLKSTLQQCLSCHAGWDKRNEDFDYEILKYGTGVSCESCHGLASEWFKPHQEDKWRKVDPRVKHAQYGQTDVRNPIVRTEQCYACHIGNVEQGKVVTHEMYAAGHPPLPSIEIESFANQIPRHWRYLNEKKDFKFADEFKAHYGYDLKTKQSIPWTDGEFPRTKNLLVGGVMASSHSVGLLADSASEYSRLRAAASTADGGASSSWPEFAAFDCAACHHDLKGDGRTRGFAGVPGRPPAQYWPRVLSRLSVAYLASQEKGDSRNEFLANQKLLQATLDRTPFGDPQELSSAGSAYSDWLRSEVANQIQSQPLNRTDALLVLELLVGCHEDSFFLPAEETWDFHSARQLVWSIHQIYSELKQPPPPIMPIEKPEMVVPNSEFGTVLAGLNKSLMLKLPATGEITTQQPKYLNTWREFDRETFLQQLEQLKEALDRENLAFAVAPAPPVVEEQVKDEDKFEKETIEDKIKNEFDAPVKDKVKDKNDAKVKNPSEDLPIEGLDLGTD